MPNSVQEVGKRELRRRFNEGGYWDRARFGDLWQRLEYEGHPSPPPSGEPFCTRSQILSYRDDDARQIARVHQYVRPDGSLGGAGEKPDPKALLEDGVLYVIFDPDEDHEPENE